MPESIKNEPKKVSLPEFWLKSEFNRAFQYQLDALAGLVPPKPLDS